MRDIDRWLDRQARRQRSVVRLEEALLGGHLARYFTYRLRYFVARTAISTLIHAAKIVLLLGAFPRDQFVAIIILQSALAMTADFWWGALEQMRSRIRDLQRRAAGYIVPREIARWLTLAVILTAIFLAAAAGFAVFSAIQGGIAPNQALIVALLIGGGLQFVTRTYHSGAYAIRRVYRPLPSLLVLDIVSVGVLLAAFPFIGLWAFALAELTSALAVTAVTIYYTSRTYRTIALPTLVPLLRERRPIPSRWALRQALAPGVSFALVGLEALIVVAGTFTLQTGASTNLVVLLAVLAPVSRAGFEWARLLYFDLKKLDVQLLRGLRDRFDRASRRLALVMGGVTWLISAVCVLVVGGLSALLLVALLAMFVARSLLGSAQIQAFSRHSYERLTLVGVGGVLGLVAAFSYVKQPELQIFAVAVVLALSFVVLLLTADDRDGAEPLLSLPDFLLRLRTVPGPVSVTRLSFDTRLDIRGTTVEVRRAEQARRTAAAEHIARRVNFEKGAAAWSSSTELWAYVPGNGASAASDVTDADNVNDSLARIVGLAGGLIDRSPLRTTFDTGQAAAREVAALSSRPSRGAQTVPSLITDFGRRFPNGICYDLSTLPPAALKALPADQRGEIYRDAIAYAAEFRVGRRLGNLEVTSLAADGVLAAVFVVSQDVDERQRRTWRNTLRDWMVRASANLEEAPSGESLPVAAPTEARML